MIAVTSRVHVELTLAANSSKQHSSIRPIQWINMLQES